MNCIFRKRRICSALYCYCQHILYSLAFVSLMMVRYESKHVRNNVLSNNRVYVTQLTFWRRNYFFNFSTPVYKM